MLLSCGLSWLLPPKSILNFPGRRRRVQGPGLVRPLALFRIELVRHIREDIRVAVP